MEQGRSIVRGDAEATKRPSQSEPDVAAMARSNESHNDHDECMPLFKGIETDQIAVALIKSFSRSHSEQHFIR